MFFFLVIFRNVDQSVLHRINQQNIKCILVNVLTEIENFNYYLVIMYSGSLMLGLSFSTYLF